MQHDRPTAIAIPKPRPQRSLDRLGAALLATLLTLALAACGPDDAERDAAERAAVDSAVASVMDDVLVRVDSFDTVLAAQPGLTANERYQLRQYLNPEQVATARQLGIDPPEDTAEVRALLRESRLVELGDTAEYWVVRELTHSFPYVTRDAHAMLTELGERFQARLDSLGLPPFRFEITSALRTQELQAELRGGNPNASRTTSSHEFGTTVDIAYRDFAAPADPMAAAPLSVPDSVDLPRGAREEVEARLRQTVANALNELGEARAPNLKGVLGEVLRSMQDEGANLPLHERGQPIFHITVAERYGSVPQGYGPGAPLAAPLDGWPTAWHPPQRRPSRWSAMSR